jgi:integrase
VFLTDRQDQVDAGELSRKCFRDYHAICARLIEHFGRNRPVESLGPEDFRSFRLTLTERCGPSYLATEVTRTKTVFRYAFDQGLIDKPVRWGNFSGPPQRVIRAHESERGILMFEPDELVRILETSEQPLRTWILLGINCAFGPADIAMLPLRAIEEDGWIEYPRHKTGLRRRCPLWVQTAECLEEMLARRPAPADEGAAKLVFLRPDGTSWLVHGQGGAITDRFRRVLRKLGLYRDRQGFYSLRRTFRTIADESLDFPAVDLIMGHARKGTGDIYRQRISDDRLRRVAEHVRQWVFGVEGGERWRS